MCIGAAQRSAGLKPKGFKMAKAKPQTAAQRAPAPTAAQCKAAGFNYNQLVITAGPTPNATPKNGTASARAKRMALLPQFYGKSVKAYFAACKATVPGGTPDSKNTTTAYNLGKINLTAPTGHKLPS